MNRVVAFALLVGALLAYSWFSTSIHSALGFVPVVNVTNTSAAVAEKKIIFDAPFEGKEIVLPAVELPLPSAKKHMDPIDVEIARKQSLQKWKEEQKIEIEIEKKKKARQQKENEAKPQMPTARVVSRKIDRGIGKFLAAMPFARPYEPPPRVQVVVAKPDRPVLAVILDDTPPEPVYREPRVVLDDNGLIKMPKVVSNDQF